MTRPFEFDQTLKLLNVLAKGPQSTLALYRQLKNNSNYMCLTSFYRYLNLCLKHGFIKPHDVQKKYTIPTKFYCLTKKGENVLKAVRNKES